MDCVQVNNIIQEGLLDNWFCKKLERKIDTYLIVTSLLLPNDDCIEFIVEAHEDDFVITDNGALFHFLFSFGIDLNAYNKQDTLNKIKKIAHNYGFDYRDKEFITRCNHSQLGLKTNLLIEAIKEASHFVYNIRESSSDQFKEEVIAFFKSKRTNYYVDYEIDGYKKTHTFDLRLNGNNEVLAKTLSEKSGYNVQISIERAWYSFNDVMTEGRSFDPLIIFNDTDDEHESAWREDHFDQLEAEGIYSIGLKSNRKDLDNLAEAHSIQ